MKADGGRLAAAAAESFMMSRCKLGLSHHIILPVSMATSKKNKIIIIMMVVMVIIKPKNVEMEP